MLRQAALDELWNPADPAGSEARLRVELERGGPYDAVERAELMTQLARAIGAQHRYDDAAEVLMEIDAEAAPVVVARVLLESGRILEIAGNSADASQLFGQAADIAGRADLPHVRVDALRMLATADPEHFTEWTAEAITVAELSHDEATQRWLIVLHDDLARRRLDSGELHAALREFTEAARWAESVGTDEQRRRTREAVEESTAAIVAADRLR